MTLLLIKDTDADFSTNMLFVQFMVEFDRIEFPVLKNIAEATLSKPAHLSNVKLFIVALPSTYIAPP